MPKCEMCKNDFESVNPRQRFCSAACRSAWAKTPEGRALNRAALARYRKTAKGKAVRAKCERDWRKTEKGKECNRRRMKVYYARKKAAGLCMEGGCWRKAWNGHARCRACHKTLIAGQRERYALRKAKEKEKAA